MLPSKTSLELSLLNRRQADGSEIISAALQVFRLADVINRRREEQDAVGVEDASLDCLARREVRLEPAGDLAIAADDPHTPRPVGRPIDPRHDPWAAVGEQDLDRVAILSEMPASTPGLIRPWR